MADEGFKRIIHDLVSPLTSVRSLSEILHSYPDISNKKQREFLRVIVQETERMTNIIRQAESPVGSTSKSIT